MWKLSIDLRSGHQLAHSIRIGAKSESRGEWRINLDALLYLIEEILLDLLFEPIRSINQKTKNPPSNSYS
jgi:hypothetical protein